MAATQADGDGWLVLDKPEGITSGAALARLRRLFGIRKAGHAGTLDPFASGVLPVAFGEATKTVPYVTSGEKGYRFTVRWGEERATDDCDGEVVARSEARPARADIEAALGAFRGEVRQRPPVYSAVHIDGERAYARARRGEAPQPAERIVTVRALDLVGAEADRATFEMACGKGVYVRAIARDLGRALGCLGHAERLRRTRAGRFVESGAVELDTIEKIAHSGARRAMLLPVAAGLDDIPALEVTGEGARFLRRGQAAQCAGPRVPCGEVAWASLRGVPVAIGVVRRGTLEPFRVFNQFDGQQE